MVTSGVATRAALDLDFNQDEDSESAVHVMMHDLKPPFLDGKTVFTKQLEPINPVRDPTSDMAVFAKKGSALVREKREQAERQKAAAKIASLGGTALGNVMGVKDDEAEAEGTFVVTVLTLFFAGWTFTKLYLRWGSRSGQKGCCRRRRLQGGFEICEPPEDPNCNILFRQESYAQGAAGVSSSLRLSRRASPGHTGQSRLVNLRRSSISDRHFLL